MLIASSIAYMNRFLWIPVGLILAGLVALLSVVRLRVPPVSEIYVRFNAHEPVEQTKDYLAKVQHQMNTPPLRDNQSDEPDMVMLSAAVYRRAIEYPDLPEVWTTAAAVINRRSQHNAKAITPICEEDASTTAQVGSSSKLKSVAFTTYENCAISLDGDGSAIRKTRRSAVRYTTRDVLELKDVHVIYRGGPPPAITIFSCVRCTFDVQLHSIPPARGKSFIRGLLMAYSENFAIEISDFSPQKPPPY